MAKIKISPFLLLVLIMAVACNSNTENRQQDKTDDVTNVDVARDIDPLLAKLNKQLEEDPEDEAKWVARANYYIGMGDLNKAFGDINKAISIDTTDAAIFTTLGDIYLEMGEVQRCEKALLKALRLEPDYLPAYLKLSRYYLIFQNYKQSMKYAEMALRQDEINAEAFYLIGFSFMETGDTAHAVRSFLTTVDLDQDYYDAWLRLGVLHATRNNELAEHYYKNALNIVPDSREARYLLAMYYQNTEQWDKAIASYDKLISLDSLYADAYFNKGYILLVYKLDYAAADEAFTEVIDINPKYGPAFLNRGLCREELGKFHEAMYDLTKAGELMNNDPKAVEALARVAAKAREPK